MTHTHTYTHTHTHTEWLPGYPRSRGPDFPSIAAAWPMIVTKYLNITLKKSRKWADGLD